MRGMKHCRYVCICLRIIFTLIVFYMCAVLVVILLRYLKNTIQDENKAIVWCVC